VIDALILGFEWTWDPGFRGVLSVLVAVVVLCGGVFLVLATNSGTRLGFLLALTGFTAWMTVMGVIWSIYGIGYRGDSPSWKVVDTVQSDPASGEVDSRIDKARSVPLPSELPDPVELRDGSDVLLAAFPPEMRDPSLGDLVTIDPDLHEELNDQATPWRVLESSNRYTGETQAVVAEALGPNDENLFASPNDYQVIESFLAGGRKPRTDDGIVSRAVYKVTNTLEIAPPPFYAVVHLQATIPQETRPGQAPPPPVRNEAEPIVSVVLQRSGQHQQRIPQFTMTFLMGVTTAVLCSMLHRRDKLAQAQREAAGAS